MEFVKRNIRDYTWKTKNAMQFTIDDTINVSESHLDMERLVLVKGNVVIDEVVPMVDRFQVKGTLNYQILYCGDKEGKEFDTLIGKVPFVEYINADGTDENDYVEVHASLNDLTVTVLHSRKISLKALLGLDYQVKANEELEAVVDLSDEPGMEVLKGDFSVMSLQMQQKKVLEVAEQVEIPANKPNIYQVIWKSMSVTGVQMKPADGYLLASGTLCVFLIYTAMEEDVPIQFVTMEVPFESKIEENICSEDMISGSVLSLDQYQITVVPDEQGEDRLIELAAQFTAEMKLYGNEEIQLVRDAYSTECELEPTCKNIMVQHLLLRNCAKTKVSDTMTMSKSQTLLQVCNVEGAVSIDETERSAKGIIVEGVVSTQVTYLNKEMGGELSSATFDIPFTYEIEVSGMREGVTYSIVPSLDQISAMQVGEDRIEIKADVSLEVLAFDNEMTRVVLDMQVKPIDMEKKKNLPSVIGYLVKKDDTLWSIAKNYYTTVGCLKEINELDSDEIMPGDKLVILKG